MIRAIEKIGHVLLATGMVAGTLAGEQNASSPPPQHRAHAPAEAPAFPVPFGPGEEALYQVKFGFVNVGEGRLTVAGLDSVRGRKTYLLEMGIQGRLGPARVDDKYQSWLDVSTLASRRFVRDVHELSYKSRREWAIYPEEKRWERVDADQDGDTPSILPLDELAFVYYIRTLPLEVGETYTLNRYFQEDGNPVVVKVLRKEVKEVPAGTFNCIVVQPIIQTDGLFSQGGNAEIYFTDDEFRHVVYLRSEITGIASLTLHLKEVREGTPLNPPWSRASGGPAR